MKLLYLDNLLRTLVHAKPHFVRCIRPNETESSDEFKRGFVVQQVIMAMRSAINIDTISPVGECNLYSVSV